WVTPLAASFTVVTCLGSASAWLGSVARIPFVAGIDNFLPTSFGRLHPRYGSPPNALTTQTAIAMALAVMGQAGTSVKGAYEVLVNLMVITQMLPFLILFASAIQLARGAPAANDLKIPGGRATVVATALVGLFTTLGAIVLSLVPRADEPNKLLAVGKVVGMTALLLAGGAALYLNGPRRLQSRDRILDDDAFLGWNLDVVCGRQVHIGRRLARPPAIVVHDLREVEPALQFEALHEEIQVGLLGGRRNGARDAARHERIEQLARPRG